MSDKTYNGWTNYATWRVNLEVFDGVNPYDHFEDANGVFDENDLADNLKAFADDFIVGDDRNFMGDYAREFLSVVNWHGKAK